MAELDAEEEPEIVATFTSGPNTRVGTIPVTYDAQRKKMLWYYFMAASMKEKEMVRTPLLYAMAGLHALSRRCLSEGEASKAWQRLCLTVVLPLPCLQHSCHAAS